MARHPQLAEKLDLLYLLQLNPKIANDSALARELSVARQTISRWRVGTSTSRGNSIPIRQIRRVADVFTIEPEWLSLTFDEFDSLVRGKLRQHSSAVDIQAEVSISMLPATSLGIFGRESELSMLSECWEDSEIKVVQLVAFGGAGKSAIVNQWLSEFRRSDYGTAQKVYAWSFYWQGESNEPRSSGDNFIEHALAWFGDKQATSGSSWSKASRLAELVKQSRTLLILDGLEPLQHPPGDKFGSIENVAVSMFIKEIAAESRGLCIITSRYPVAELKSFSDGRVRDLFLNRLSTQDGEKLLNSLGVLGSHSQMAEMVERYSGHALSLSLVSGFLNVVHNGDITKLNQMSSLFDSRRHQSQIREIMRHYFGWLEGTADLQLLRLLSLLGRATELTSMLDLINQGLLNGVTDKLSEADQPQIYYLVENLKDANLISVYRDSEQLTMDCHPLVRDAVSDEFNRTDKKSWQSAHGLIFDCLRAKTTEMPANVAEFELLYRAVSHGAHSQRYPEAFSLYRDRLRRKQFSIFARGSHYADRDCLRSFFEIPWSKPVTALPEEAQIFLTISVATNLIYLGEVQEAINPSEKSIEWFATNNRFLEAVTAAAPLLSMYIAVGDLSAAESLIERMEPIVLSANNIVVHAMTCNFKGYLSHLKGDQEQAGIYFAESERVLQKAEPPSTANFPTISSYYCKFLLDTGDIAGALERSLKTFAWRTQKSWQVAVDTVSILASDMLVLGLTFLAKGDKANAKQHLDNQVELFKSADEWLYLPTGLIGRAKLHEAERNFDDAVHDLETALQISLRTGAKFGEWESYLGLAGIHLEKNEIDKARMYLNKARGLEKMRSFRFRDAEIESLERVLG